MKDALLKTLLPEAGIRTLHGTPFAFGNCVLAAGFRHDDAPMILAAAPARRNFPAGLTGEIVSCRDGFLLSAPANADNLQILTRLFPRLQPGVLADQQELSYGDPARMDCCIAELPSDPERSSAQLNRIAFARFPDRRDVAFAAEFPALSAVDAVRSGARRFRLHYRESQLEVFAAEAYHGKIFFREGKRFCFSRTERLNRYAAWLTEARHFRDHVATSLKKDFLVLLDPAIAGEDPPSPEEYFMLARELRRCGESGFGLIADPDVYSPEDLARIVSCHSPLRQRAAACGNVPLRNNEPLGAARK